MHPSTWTYQQAVGYSLMAGAAIALVVCLGLLGLAKLWNRPARRRPDGSGNMNNAPAPWDREAPPPGKAKGVKVGRIVGCARCGGDHANRLLLPLTNQDGEFTHYTQCPTLDEPVFVRCFLEKPVGPPNRLVREGEQPPARSR